MFVDGVRLILQHPLQYVLMSGVEFVRLTYYVYPSKLSVLRNWVVTIGLVTLVVSLARHRSRTPEQAWLALSIAAFTLPSIVGDTQPRYGVPLVPLYSLFAASGLLGILRFTSSLAGRRRDLRDAPHSLVHTAP
jgi:hypothetical protein